MKRDPATLPPETLLTVRQAAQLMGVSEKYLRLSIRGGLIRTIRWGSDLRIAKWYLIAWQDQQINFPERRAQGLVDEDNVATITPISKHTRSTRYANVR